MSKDFFSQLIPNHAYIREVDIESKRIHRLFKKKQSLSKKQILNKIINTSYNKKWPDGRIYGLDKEGKYVSHSVSPYADSFLDNIEENIKPLIIALKNKGYFSISSCQGHSLWDRRFLKLIFPSKDTALDFQKHIPFKVKYNLKHATDFLNVDLDIDEFGNIKNATKNNLLKNKSQALEYINFFIKRNYSDAWFMEIIIADSIPHSLKPWQYLKYLKDIVFKKIFLNYYTNKITQHVINSLPANIY